MIISHTNPSGNLPFGGTVIDPSTRPSFFKPYNEVHIPFDVIRPTAVKPSTMRTIMLEVERKFSPSLANIQNITANSGRSPFRRLQAKALRVFRDTYYDRADKLSAAGIWLRRRRHEKGLSDDRVDDQAGFADGRWEAKIRRGGNFERSAFEETTSTSTIAELVRQYAGDDGFLPVTGQGNFGLEVLADFTTTRASWLADEEFTIDVDTTCFGHRVGEVELVRHLEGKTMKADLDHCTREAMSEMEDSIDAFMRRYRQLLPVRQPKGKLSAYFDSKVASTKGTC